MFAAYMDAHPNEVLTFICQCDVAPADFGKIIESHAIYKYVHSQPKDKPWPKLKDMIASGKRLVFLNDRTDGTQDWYHYQYDYCCENPYSNKKVKAYNCDMKPAADLTKSLYIFNHFITGSIARRSKNRKANSYAVLMPRVKQCMENYGKKVNFLTVDWYHWGDLFRVVDELNGIEPPKSR